AAGRVRGRFLAEPGASPAVRLKQDHRTLRNSGQVSRTHAVTLGYMGTVQARKGNVEAACHTWAQALDAMEGVQSGRAREAAVNMRRVLSPFRNRGISVAAEIDERAKAVLERVA